MRTVVSGFLLLCLACPVWGVDVHVPVKTGGSAVGGQAGAAVGSGGRVSGPRLDLSAPTLLPSLNAPLSPDAVIGGKTVPVGTRVNPAVSGEVNAPVRSVNSAPLLRPAGASLALPAPVGKTRGRIPAKAAPQDKGGPAVLKGRGGSGVRTSAKEAAKEAGKGTPGEFSGKAAVGAGRRTFDGAAESAGRAHAAAVKAKPFSIGGFLRSLLTLPESVPDYPGAAGRKARIAGKKYALYRKIFEDADSTAYEAGGYGGTTWVRLLKPSSVESFKGEIAALREMGGTDIPHLTLVAVSEDGRAVVQKALEGNGGTLRQELARGGWRTSRKNALADLAAKLIRLGRTADLGRDNLSWSSWRSYWQLLRAEGFRDGSPWEVLSQLWADDILETAGWTRAEFLSALRGRLEPDSRAWRRILKESEGVAELRKALDALAREDAARPPPPKLSFESARENAVLSDALLTPKAMRKRLGFDPMRAGSRKKLKHDDGKLNTEVFSVNPDGKADRVVKVSEVRIIRNELFVRKIVHRFFAKYFDAPWSLAYLDGYQSVMVMEPTGGGANWAKAMLSREQRVALAVLVRSFGLSDMHPDNIHYDKGRVVLFDFEQALGRHAPVAGRIPDAGILLELPWVRSEKMAIEDFFEGIRAWRELFDKPETQGEIERMMAESGFTPDEVAYYMDRVRRNVADLTWTLQTDVDFSNMLGNR